MVWKNSSRVLERCLMAVGIVLVAVATAGMLHRASLSRLALWQFDRVKAEAEHKKSLLFNQSKPEQGVDFSLWAEKRIQAYRNSLISKTDPPLAVLQIDKLGIRVPVFDGTDDLTLNRGVGRILGTASLGDSGNVGIAGHRDGFFRGLKDIAVGDEVDLMTTTAKATYAVDQIEIVSPADVQVLRARNVASITLVTCFPFYFVGDAPKRFIVHASLVSRSTGSRLRRETGHGAAQLKDSDASTV